MSVWGVVVAAGRGTRAGLAENKVFFRYGGRSILSRCLDALTDTGLFDGLVLVIARRDEAAYQDLCEREGACPLVRRLAWGGESRRESVLNGLLAMPEDADIVAIHDAARPFVTRDIIEATVESARRYGSGVISTPVVDTIKVIQADGKVVTPDRAAMRAVQTPQTFQYRLIRAAHERAQQEDIAVTDDAMLYERCYGTVRLVTAPGAQQNIKLTTAADFEQLSLSHALRVGHGYDAHRLVPDRKLVLCGVEVPYSLGLLGHSDADVALHALMDALLGAMGEGDLGHLFPDSDPKYKGISSMRLLEQVMHRLRSSGWCVVNADITIVAQQPKLAPYKAEMCHTVASALGIGENCVNVKATTTEHMGFEGEGIGISAQAVALIERL